MNLIDAIQQKDTLTENGMMTNSSSLNHCVNLFFQIGAMRGVSTKKLLAKVSKAFNEDPLTTIRIIFWARDVRGGVVRDKSSEIVYYGYVTTTEKYYTKTFT